MAPARVGGPLVITVDDRRRRTLFAVEGRHVAVAVRHRERREIGLVFIELSYEPLASPAVAYSNIEAVAQTVDMAITGPAKAGGAPPAFTGPVLVISEEAWGACSAIPISERGVALFRLSPDASSLRCRWVYLSAGTADGREEEIAEARRRFWEDTE